MFRQVTYVISQAEIKSENLREKCRPMSRPVELADFSEFSFSDVGVANDRNNRREGHYNV